CASFSYVLLRLTQRHRQLSSAPWFTGVAFNITSEQTEKGLKWLRRMRKRLPPQDAQVIDNFDRFLFEGVVHYERQLLPLYRVVAKDGTWFSYTPSP
ncbi:MAG: hypothetical protein MZW92_31210, partial [Comamonadaceae bacterium]|nr:hypothetical protein [Comamonadaceae bacterium]